jgi:hypothetical protein
VTQARVDEGQMALIASPTPHPALAALTSAISLKGRGKGGARFASDNRHRKTLTLNQYFHGCGPPGQAKPMSLSSSLGELALA